MKYNLSSYIKYYQNKTTEMCLPNTFDRLNGLFIQEQPPLFAHYSPISTPALLITRIISCLYLTGFYIYDFSDSQSLLNRFIYLTNVGFFLTWLYFLVSLQAKFITISKGLDFAAEVLFQVSFCLQVFITIAYWSVIYLQTPSLVGFNNANWHGVPIALLLLDFVFNSYRFIPSQYWAYVIVVFLYMVCCNLPYSVGVSPVYGKASDWVGWMTYALVAAGFITGALVHLLGWAISKKLKEQKILEMSNNQVTQNGNNQLTVSQNVGTVNRIN